jgi:hypothetical protein
MTVSPHEIERCAAITEIDGRQVVAHLIRPVTTIRDITQAKLTTSVNSPTFHLSIVKPSTGVCVACCKVYRPAAGTEIDGWQIVAHLARTASAFRQVANAELALKPKTSPALHLPIVEPGTGMPATCSKLHRDAAGTQEDRWQVIAHFR